MRLMKRILVPVLLCLLAIDADAFQPRTSVGSAIISTAKKLATLRTVAKKVRKYSDPGMFKDRNGDYLHLPKSMSVKDRFETIIDLQKSSLLDQEGPLLASLVPEAAEQIFEMFIPVVDYNTIIGTPKPKETTTPRSSEWLQIYTDVINKVIYGANPDQRMPCEGYLYFGNQDYTKILSVLCQSDPFFASALTVAGDNDEFFELDIKGKHKYAEVMRTMRSNVTPKDFSVRFNKDMTLCQIVDHSGSTPKQVPKSEWNYYASGVCYTMYIYAQSIHALIHVLHYFMTIGMNMSTEHNESLKAWAELYDDNIALKYIEVAAVLYDSTIQVEGRGGNDGKKLTGKNGLGGTRYLMDGPMLDILCDWGSFKSADDFTTKFLLKGIYDTAKNPEKVLESGKILTEFRKHLANVGPFADEMTAAMKADDRNDFDKAEKLFAKFMSEIGEGVSSMGSISSFIQMMSCTGMMHGSTLGFTRLTIMPEVIRWLKIEEDVWSKEDTEFISQTMGTMGGMAPGRHVFTAEVQEGTAWDMDDITTRVKRVLKKYDKIAGELKSKYQKEIEKRDDFREFGWTLTDHCPEGYDGKQHTITTYI